MNLVSELEFGIWWNLSWFLLHVKYFHSLLVGFMSFI